MSGSFIFLMIFRFLRAVRHAILFVLLFKQSRLKCQRCVCYMLVDQKNFLQNFRGKQQKIYSLFSFFLKNLPFYCPSFFFPICHLHFIKTRIACCVSSYYIPLKSFLFGCNPIKGEAKKHKQTPKSCPVTLIYFLSSSSAVIENLFKHIF